jgi:hypothetical protein
VNATRDSCTAETRTNLEALSGRDAQHGVGQLGLHLVETRFAQTRGDVADDTSDVTTNAVLLFLELCDQVGHAFVGLGVGATNGEVLVDLLAGDLIDELEELGVGGRRGVVCSGREEHLVADGRGEGDNLDAVSEGEVLLGDGAGSDAAWLVLVDWKE